MRDNPIKLFHQSFFLPPSLSFATTNPSDRIHEMLRGVARYRDTSYPIYEARDLAAERIAMRFFHFIPIYRARSLGDSRLTFICHVPRVP